MKTKLFFISMFWISITSYSQNTYVPDDNFEQALINKGYDSGSLNDSVPTANINTVTYLDVFGSGISDLTGIEDFVILTNLGCASNQITNLDITNNMLLQRLNCYENNLTSLDVTNNTLLQYLACWDNNLTSLDVSNNTALEMLVCFDNSLTDLDVTNNALLMRLYCFMNNLGNLDVSNNTSLNWLECLDNNLTALNVKNSNNINFSEFSAWENPSLECIEVDDATWSTNNWSNIDSQSYFSEDCPALSADEFETSIFKMYPNPVNELLTISLKEVANYSLINLNGQILSKGELDNGENELNISSLSNGLYFLKVKTDDEIITKKLIKQ